MENSSPNHLPPFAETADIETASDDYATRFSGTVGNYFLAIQTNITLDLLKDFPRASILDIGGGHAQLATPLIQKGFSLTVTGSNVSCRQRLDRFCKPGSFQYLSCDSLNLPFDDGHFDVCMAFRLLPHTKHWRRLVQEMCRVARKAVILDYPDRRSANILYDLLFSLKKNLEGNTRTYAMFTREEMRNLFTTNRFAPPIFKPEFFAPMVIHRKLQNPAISRNFEYACGVMGLTKLFGSPVILRSDKLL